MFHVFQKPDYFKLFPLYLDMYIVVDKNLVGHSFALSFLNDLTFICIYFNDVIQISKAIF